MPTFTTLDPVAYHRDALVAAGAGERGSMAAGDLAGVAPLALHIDGDAWTYRATDGRVEVTDGISADAGTVVAMSRQAWSDLVQQLRTAPALLLADELKFERGGFSGLGRWEPALRALYAGVPIYDPAAVDTTQLDLHHAFTLHAPDGELRDFLDAAGYLQVRSVFTTDEIAEMNAEIDRLAADATPGDDRSWWATAESGAEVLCRLVYANLGSRLLADLGDDERVRRLVHLPKIDVRPTLDRMEGHSVLLKRPGRLQGLSNIPWHTDCGLGGHPVLCPSLQVGVQLTAANPELGQLEVLPGSHGKSCRYGTDGVTDGLPVVKLDTEAGDVTLHYADVMHASPPPHGAGGRRTMYLSFVNPALFDHIGPGQAINDLVRNRQAAAGAINPFR